MQLKSFLIGSIIVISVLCGFVAICVCIMSSKFSQEEDKAWELYLQERNNAKNGTNLIRGDIDIYKNGIPFISYHQAYIRKTSGSSFVVNYIDEPDWNGIDNPLTQNVEYISSEYSYQEGRKIQ